ncbi:mechanosensitive ion channel family protein [Amaricoccus tamworthensis]|uniref:mechanosensitive ion channel family protein n=1 Tax=Amaricoccus tamworthensis TaxID=57002 RepID=UPI003C7E2E98
MEEELPEPDEALEAVPDVAELVEPVSDLLEPVWAWVDRAHDWFDAVILSTASLAQLAAIMGALMIALAVAKPFRRFVTRVSENQRPFIKYRVARTVASISQPIIWLLGLWLSASVLVAMGEPIVLMRLVYSLISAWVLIRLATVFIPSNRWSAVFSWCAWSVAALNAVGLLYPTIDWLDMQSLSMGELRISLWTVAKGAILVGGLVWAAYWLSKSLEAQLERTRTLSPSMQVLIGKLLRIGLFLIAVIIGLRGIGIDLTALAVFSGAVGIGIGLGMQRIVGNLVAGFSMLADKSIKPGDVIEIETGDGPTYGTVKKLNARYASVLTRSGTETLIPNEILISNPVTNWSFSNTKVRRGIPVGVAYDSDVERAMELCVEAALACPRVLRDPEPKCLMRGFGDSSVDLEVRFWIVDPDGGVANISSEVYLQIWKRFQANDIEIPFPQRDLRLRSGFEALVGRKDSVE